MSTDKKRVVIKMYTNELLTVALERTVSVKITNRETEINAAIEKFKNDWNLKIYKVETFDI